MSGCSCCSRPGSCCGTRSTARLAASICRPSRPSGARRTGRSSSTRRNCRRSAPWSARCSAPCWRTRWPLRTRTRLIMLGFYPWRRRGARPVRRGHARLRLPHHDRAHQRAAAARRLVLRLPAGHRADLHLLRDPADGAGVPAGHRRAQGPVAEAAGATRQVRHQRFWRCCRRAAARRPRCSARRCNAASRTRWSAFATIVAWENQISYRVVPQQIGTELSQRGGGDCPRSTRPTCWRSA